MPKNCERLALRPHSRSIFWDHFRRFPGRAPCRRIEIIPFFNSRETSHDLVQSGLRCTVPLQFFVMELP